MTIDTTTADATEHHPILPETWRQIFALVELCSDPKGFKRRLHGLANALSAVDAATRKLAEDRAQHEARLAKETAELEQQKKMAASVWEIAKNAERAIADREQTVRRLEAAWGAYGCRVSRLRCLAPSAGRRHSPDLR